MIKELLKKFKMAKVKKWVHKPQFPIYLLYTGKIVYLQGKEKADNGYSCNFRPVKNFAIFNYDLTYFHVVSSQKLNTMGFTTKKDYCIHELEEFSEHPEMKMFMRKKHLTEESLLSFAQIVALEEAMNQENIYTEENDKIFY